ncbi:hypothetical protein F4818DRAFT_441455 [Hypoxylon cercidicola]|nr:hypothetical protein F4818DRAFT_441455 [Hypoxylon cercidicola]
MDSSQGIRTDTFLGVGIFLVVLPALFVFARLAGNIKLRRGLRIADWLSILAIILLAGTLVNFMLIVNALADPAVSIFYLLQLVAASGPVAASTTWVCKAPILFLYVQIFGIKRWMRMASYATLVITFFYLLGWNIWLLYKNVPRIDQITPEFLVDSSYAGSVAGVASGAMGLAADVVIFILPFPVIGSLQLPMHKKIGLAIVFLTGLLAVVASAVGVYFKYLSLSGTSTDIKGAMILTIIELSIAIIVGCVPAASTFWTTIVVQSALYSRISTALSLISLTRSNRSRHTQGVEAGSNVSAEYINVDGRQYDASDDGRSTGKSMGSYRATTNVVPLRDIRTSEV